MHRYFLIVLFTVNAFKPGLTQTDSVPDYFDNNYRRYTNYIYRESIKTVEMYCEGRELSYPIIELNSNDKIKLSFDDLDGGTKNYWYRLIHCDAGWQPSGLSYSDYLDGFEFNRIYSYKFSFNTLCRYTHYNLSIPNDDVKLKISGNYLLEVLEDNDESLIVLSGRFCVVEYRLGIDAEVKRATVIDLKKSHQEIDFTIRKDSRVSDPYSQLKVILLQNNRWDNAITGLKPVFVRNDQLIYDFDEDNNFAGGSEYRYFNIKSVRFRSERTDSLTFEPPYYHIYLVKDERRPFKIYSYHEDINGKFKVDVEQGDDAENEADYVYVTFTLPYDAPVVNGNIYVSGGLAGWTYDATNRMKYSFKEKAYKLTMFLKQGYYNYEYVFVKDGTTSGNNTYIEGSHYETENDYLIYVYFRDFSSRCDKLVGLKIVNSLKKL
jgi:hypothetical protein